MAASMHNTIRLDLTLSGQLPANTYDIELTSIQRPYAAVVSERGLTGTLHIHRVMDGSDPKSFKDFPCILHVNRTQYDALFAQLGKVLYFMENWRDDADTATHRRVMLFKMMEPVEHIDPMEAYCRVSILLEDATGSAVDS